MKWFKRYRGILCVVLLVFSTATAVQAEEQNFYTVTLQAGENSKVYRGFIPKLPRNLRYGCGCKEQPYGKYRNYSGSK